MSVAPAFALRDGRAIVTVHLGDPHSAIASARADDFMVASMVMIGIADMNARPYRADMHAHVFRERG
jgi:hypothetical protein